MFNLKALPQRGNISVSTGEARAKDKVYRKVLACIFGPKIMTKQEYVLDTDKI